MSTSNRLDTAPLLSKQLDQVNATLVELQKQLRYEKYACDVDRPSYDELRLRLLSKNRVVETLADRVLSLETVVRQIEREMLKLKDQSVHEKRDLVSANDALSKMSHIAFYDVLTQLPNRRFFERALGLACDKSSRLHRFSALMYIDIDRFRTVNDLWGHSAGDSLLMLVAQRLKASVRKVDTVARLGGDEFAMIFSNISSKSKQLAEVMTTTANNVCQALANPFTLVVSDHKGDVQEIELHTAVSVGVVLFDGQSQTPSQLLDLADKAMYEAKQRGGNQVVVLSSC
jgi:diguanylate cyclase (GGDEF)-like protein